jgi:hypothetical protein
MISLRLQRYAGRKLRAGDKFEASRRDAKLLERMGMAAVAPPVAPAVAKADPAAENLTAASLDMRLLMHVRPVGVSQDWDAPRRAAQADVELMKAEMTVVAEPEETLEPAEPAAEDAPRPKRKYTRRDMTAE